MEGAKAKPNSMFAILESSSSFWLHPSPPLTSVTKISSPQTCNQNLGTITNSHVQREVNIQEPNKNLNTNSDKNSGRGKEKVMKPKTWYKGPWTSREDRKLILLVERFGMRRWSSVAIFLPGRIGKQCRERWHNNLRPTIEKKVVWSDEEERMIIKGHLEFGNRWSAIARYIPGRSENAVKNHWNSLKRKQFSTRTIQRPHKLRGLYTSNLLENYIKKLFFKPPTAAAPPPFAATPIAPPDTPLSVDDYDVDGVPYFSFEIAELMHNLYTDDNGNANANARMYLPPATHEANNGMSTSYFAVETVDEETSFMTSMFGNNGGM